jgi:small GTP-binding protein
MFKVAMLGDAAVGKTSVRRNYLGKSFISSHIATIGVDFAQKLVKVDDRPIRLVIWDLAGQDGYQRVRKNYYEGSSALILVYDVTNRTSFDNASAWLTESYKHTNEIPPVAVLGNKIDLRISDSKSEFVQSNEGAAFTKSLGDKLGISTIFFETSAKTGENIQEAFTDLGRILIDEDDKASGKRIKKKMVF